MAKSNPHQSPQCHYCPASETFYHLCTCSNPVSDLFRHELLETVTEYMTNKDTPESFQQAFLQSLHIALNLLLSVTRSPLSQAATACVNEQSQLGPNALLQGFWTNKWKQLFVTTCSFYSLETPNEPTTFLAGLGTLLWKGQYKLWDTHLKTINSDNIAT